MVDIGANSNISGARAWKPTSGATDSEASLCFVKDEKNSYLNGIETIAKNLGRVGVTD